MAKTAVPALLRQQVDRWAEAWLAAKFSRLLELRASDPGPFNYPIAVFSEWRGNAFYLNVRYRARSRNPDDDFVVRHTRMTLTGFGRFDLAYFRHTDKWFTVYRGLTATDCFREIEENEISGRRPDAEGEACCSYLRHRASSRADLDVPASHGVDRPADLRTERRRTIVHFGRLIATVGSSTGRCPRKHEPQHATSSHLLLRHVERRGNPVLYDPEADG